MSESKAKINTVYVFGYLFTLVLGSLHVGYNLSIFPNCQSIFMELYRVKGNKIALYSSILNTTCPLGAFLFSLIVSPLAEKGRRRVLNLAGVSSFLSIIIALYLPTLISNPKLAAVLGRTVMGFGEGIYLSMIPDYINEISPTRYSSFFGCCHQLFVGLGIVTAAFMGVLLPDSNATIYKKRMGLNIAFSFPMFISLVQILLLQFVYKYEAPLFLVNSSNDLEAEKALKEIYKNKADVVNKLNSLIKLRSSTHHKTNTMISLYSIYPAVFWIGISIPLMQQLTGINVITFTGPQLFASHGQFGKVLMLLTTIISLLSTIVAIIISDKYPRKTLLLVGSIGCATTLFICSFTYTAPKTKGISTHMTMINWIFSMSVFTFMLFFRISYGALCWIYLSEFLPRQWMGYASASSWASMMLVSLTTPYLMKAIHRYIFLLYGLFMSMSACVVKLLLKETKGKQKQQILNEFIIINKEI